MIIIGAGGFAKELAEIFVSKKYHLDESNLYFFDNVSENVPEKLFGRFNILRSFEEAEEIFMTESPDFSIGIGVPKLRYKLSAKFESIGGQLISAISDKGKIGSFGIFINSGCIIMDGASISNDVSVGKGTLVNSNSFIGHDVAIGEFSEIMPGTNITGHCKIGNYSSLGTGVVVTPNVKIGNNVSIAAGSVITNNIPDNSQVVGVLPSRVVGKMPEFEL